MKLKSSNGNRSFEQHRMVPAVKRVEFVSYRMSYIFLRGRWCNIFLNVHAPIKTKSDDSKTVFMRIKSSFFYHFPKYHMKILLGEFNAKVGERIFQTDNGERESTSG